MDEIKAPKFPVSEGEAAWAMSKLGDRFSGLYVKHTTPQLSFLPHDVIVRIK